MKACQDPSKINGCSVSQNVLFYPGKGKNEPGNLHENLMKKKTFLMKKPTTTHGFGGTCYKDGV